MAKLKYGKLQILATVKSMAKITVLIKDDLDEKFREAVFKAKGMHRGNMTEAIEEALEMWIDKQARSQGKKGDK
jgi:hypothetical protein